jgi:hypothetical protein
VKLVASSGWIALVACDTTASLLFDCNRGLLGERMANNMGRPNAWDLMDEVVAAKSNNNQHSWETDVFTMFYISWHRALTSGVSRF